jgi:N-acetylmuramoyl-L-alanine amidase
MARRGWLIVAAAVALVALSQAVAFAGESAPPVAVGARLAQDETNAQLVFDLSRAVEARAYALTSPDRIVVDLPEVNFQIDPSVGRVNPAGAQLIKAFRFGLLSPGRSRIVLDLVGPACPAEVDAKPIVAGAPAARLKIEVKPCPPDAFAALVRAPESSTAASKMLSAAAPPVIVLDPGHGGADGGARGYGGAVEKTLVFDFCSELRRQLQATGRYKIVMTRDGDQYVDLDDRVALAKDANADLFVSIHADTLREAVEVSGSTVYTVADRASDAEAARIAARENAADRTPGKSPVQLDPGVADILFDLKRRETRAYSHIFSRGLVENLRSAARLNANPERSAGFVVLKAPEFPSVLVELGYLSNPQDVQALSSPEWRAKTAAAMVRTIDVFFASPKGETSAAGAGVMLGDGGAGAPSH